jgi:hypothetical protein
MSDADDALVRATDSLIALYRSVERSTLDLPLISVMPILTFIWAFLRFYFFFLVGIFLIIPTNLVILIRNIFPGYWRYRPFFLTHVYYCWLWIWRGEAPTAPFIFLRPLLNVFMKGHFETRLRRLRLEILDRDELSDATRSALLGRVDAALERWKSPRFAALFYSVLVPAIMWLPGWYKQLIEFLGSLGIRMPTDVVANFISEEMSTNSLVVFGPAALGYLIAIPITAFLAKRGLFIGRNPDRICFPGGQEGVGIYSKEREILNGVGLRVREAPIDLWLLGVGTALGYLMLLLTWDRLMAWLQSDLHETPEFVRFQIVSQFIVGGLFLGLFFVAALRRRRTGRL